MAPAPPLEAPPIPEGARRADPWHRLRAAFAWVRDRYFVIDPRTAGVFRIALGLLLLADCIRHWSHARLFYSNAGVLTNHYHLFRPSSPYNFSLFHAFSSPGEVHLAFALACACFTCFCVGWHTRLFSILSFVLVTSLDNRLVMVENGGYVVVNILVGWAMFLPTEKRFSVDALGRSFRERDDRTPRSLGSRDHLEPLVKPHVSLAALYVLANLATIYYFNVINKSGAIWRHGEAVHYVLHLDRMITGVAVFAREHLPYWSTKPLTYAVLVAEALLVPWILAPEGRRFTRPLAIVMMWLLHTTFGVMMRLGPFSWFLLAWSALLLGPEQWHALEAWHRRRAKTVVLVYDAQAPLGLAIARLVARLDPLGLVCFEANVDASPSLLMARSPKGEHFAGRAMVGEIAQALPCGRTIARALHVLTLGQTDAVVDAIDRHRTTIARFFGLERAARHRAPRATSPFRQRMDRSRVVGRELVLAYLGLAALSQGINENKSVPEWLKHKQPKIIEATIGYPRIYQGWGMFAPNPIQEDGTLTVEAWTIGGRRVDPFTNAEPDLDITDARGLGLDQITQDYFNRVRLDRNRVFRQPLRDYLLRWHEETGRPEDELVAFDVYWVHDQCPPPGQNRPSNNQKTAILTYRKPGVSSVNGAPLPPEPKVESAGN